MRVSFGITGKLFVVAILGVVLNSDSSYGNDDERCGPFNLFEGTDYCIQCPSEKGRRHYYCPGGELGLAILTAENYQCQVSEYNPQCEQSSSDDRTDNETHQASPSTQGQSDLMRAIPPEFAKEKITVTFTREQLHTLSDYVNDPEAVSIFEKRNKHLAPK